MRSFVVPLALILAALVLWLVISPPRFWMNLTNSVEPTATVGGQLVEAKGCRSCHRIGGEGALKAVSLDGIVARQRDHDPALVTLRLWLRNPKAINPSSPMPNFHLSDSQIEAILLYLQE